MSGNRNRRKAIRELKAKALRIVQEKNPKASPKVVRRLAHMIAEGMIKEYLANIRNSLSAFGQLAREKGMQS